MRTELWFMPSRSTTFSGNICPLGSFFMVASRSLRARAMLLTDKSALSSLLSSHLLQAPIVLTLQFEFNVIGDFHSWIPIITAVALYWYGFLIADQSTWPLGSRCWGFWRLRYCQIFLQGSHWTLLGIQAYLVLAAKLMTISRHSWLVWFAPSKIGVLYANLAQILWTASAINKNSFYQSELGCATRAKAKLTAPTINHRCQLINWVY